MQRTLSISNVGRMAGMLLAGLMLMWALSAYASTRDQPATGTEAINWAGTVLAPSNDAAAGSQLTIRPPPGARFPQVSVQLAGQALRVVSASPDEVRVQLPAQPVAGPLTMTNVDSRLTGTLAPNFRVVSTAPRVSASADPRTTAAGRSQPRTLAVSSPGAASQHLSGNGYMLIHAGGEEAPVLFGEDNTQANQGQYDVSGLLEVLEFSVAVNTGQQGTHGSSQSTGHRVWHPARFLLRVDKSTPFLFEAARMNKRIDLTLHLFHRHHQSGVVEQNAQYRIQQGRIVSIGLVKPGSQRAAEVGLPYYVEIQIVPNTSEVESMTGGTVMVDNWANRGA